MSIDKELVRQLVEGTISDENAQHLLRLDRKDHDRFAKYIAVLQEQAAWPDPILMRLSEHVFIVAKPDNRRITKCTCGHEFGDYRENWKLHCRVNVRQTAEQIGEVYYPAPACPEPDWQEVREYYCPSCARQLAVEVVPPGYPIIFEMLPDLDRFYADYLDSPLPDAAAFSHTDLSHQLTASWART